VASDLGRSVINTKVTYLVSHPIQYQAPLLRRIANEEGISLRVIFEKNFSGSPHYDSGFRRDIKWDVPLTEGYNSVSVVDTSLFSEIRNAEVLWLHGWETPLMHKALLLARFLGTPVLMRGENSDLAMPDGTGIKGWFKRCYINWVLSFCHAFLAIGTENKKYYLHRGISENQIFLTPYAVDNEYFEMKAKAAIPQRDKLRLKLGITPGKKIILFVGKFMPRKRPDVLVQAINSVDWEIGKKPALIFVGGGEMETRLRTLVPNAIFLGFKNQSELASFYDIADVLVLPSEREPWGLVVNEAMACGTAVIVSDQVGCATDLLNDECGKVFSSGDVRALADSIVYCLLHSKEMGEIAGSAIKKWGFSEDIIGFNQAINYIRSPDVADQ